MFSGYKKVNKKHYAWLIILLAPIYYICMMLSVTLGLASDLLELACYKMDELTKRKS